MGILSFVTGGLLGGLNDAANRKASSKAVAAVQDASDKNTALARNIYDTTRGDLAPYRTAGTAGLSALMRELGLNDGSTATGARGTAGTSPMEPPAPAGFTPNASPAPSSQPDYAAYGAANPDLQAEWAHIQQTGNADGFGGDPNAYFKWHYDTYGKNEPDRVPPPVLGAQPAGPEQPPPTDGGAANEDPYVDPASTNYGAGAAPAPYDPSQHAQFQDPGTAPAFAFDFKADPGYAWRQAEALRGGNAAYGAKGLLKSGGAIKAAQDRSYNLADQSYNTAFDQYMQRLNSDRNQFNTDRQANFNIFNTNRNFDYGATRDTRGDFETDRNFGAGRYDQRISDLFGLTSTGAGAAAGTANAGNIYTSAASAANNNVANARANKSIYDNSNSFLNQLLPAVANAAGRSAAGGF